MILKETDVGIHPKQVFNLLAEDKEFIKNIREQIQKENVNLTGKELEQAVQKKANTVIKEIQTKINKLKKLMNKSEKNLKINLYYWRTKQGVSGIGTKNNSIMYNIIDDDIQEAFNLINEIAAMMRGEEEIILRVSLIGKDGKVHIVEVPESKVKTNITETKYKNKQTETEYIVKELQYSLKDLKDNYKEMKISNSFNNHYMKFFEMSHSLISEREAFKGANEGHITEAFYEHFNSQHPGKSFSETIEDDLDTRQVAISLWSSYKNKAGWWKAGDVANIQIKALNTRLASVNSIKVLANQMMFLFSQDIFDWSRFKKVFTEQTNPITDEIIEDLLKT